MSDFNQLMSEWAKSSSMMPEAKADELDYKLQSAGLFGKNLDAGKDILEKASQGELPEKKEFKQAAQVATKLTTPVVKSESFKKAAPIQQQEQVSDELQKDTSKEMSNKELLARILIGFAPTVIGAAVGGITGVGIGAGGEAGAKAGLAGLNALEEQKKEAERKAQLQQKNALESAKYLLQAKKEGAEEKRREREVALKEKEFGLKAKESTQVAVGQRLPADKVITLAEFQSIPQLLGDLKSTVETNAESFGPVQGRVSSLLPYQNVSQTIDAQVRNVRQTIGKLKEGGVLRAEDEIKYAKMLPNLTDTPEVALNKIELVGREMNQKFNNITQGLKLAGYDTSGFEQKLSVPQVPKAIQPQGIFSLPEAQATSAKPPITQNGHTYIWNSKTGRYE